MAELKFDTVDVFTETRYEGNPLAIVHVPASISLTQAQKQRIAAEFNLSETVILHENPDDAYDRKVDIFLVDGEIPFAGHPTIGTIAHIGQHGPASSSSDSQAITLHIKAGTCHATYQRSSGVARASIPFDIYFSSLVPPSSIPHDVPSSSLASVPLAVVSPTKGMTFLLAETHSLASLSALSTKSIRSTDAFEERFVRAEVKPSLLGTYFWACGGFEAESKANGMQATFAIEARMMLPSVPPEDPATGSAACTLACAISTWRRWAKGKVLGPEDGEDAARGHRPDAFERFPQPDTKGRRDRYEVTQGRDMGRLSRIVVEVVVNERDEIVEVVLEGKAVEVMRGTLKV